MPKARKHKKGPTKKKMHASANHVGADLSRPSATRVGADSSRSAMTAKPARRAFASPAANNVQSLITPAIVALGCWGLTLSFAFFYSTDPNHLLYAGVAAAMALIWTIICANRVYKIYMRRQKA
jgi:hypothetical protein